MGADTLETTRLDPPLSQREAEVLRLIVESHIRRARGIGSRRLVSAYDLAWSPATVRVCIASLAERGLVARAHASAGAEPTGFGYRVYVDRLMRREDPSIRARRLLEGELRRGIADRRAFLLDLARVVGAVSRHLGLALWAQIGEERITTLELLPRGRRTVLVVLGIGEAAIRTERVTLAGDATPNGVERARRVLRDRLLGSTVAEARARIDREIAPQLSAESDLLGVLAGELSRMVAEAVRGDLIVGPAWDVALQAEFAQGDRLRSLLRLLDQPQPLVRALSASGESGVRVRIGPEGGAVGLEGFSTVSLHLRSRNGALALGLLGPMRMDYARSVGLMEWLGPRLEGII